MKTWEWDNLLLFPGNDTHKSSTGECKVKEVRATTLMKHDTGGGGSPSSRENRMLAAPPPPPHVEKQRKQSGLVTVAVPALSGDSVIGLKLGKRTYFEAVKAIPAAAPKKQRSGMQGTQVAKCQVEECKIELSGAKDYHRRHKVCEMHSKSAKVTVAGIEQRFCQQCTRFHVLSEFDEGKRSCRRRLAGHNERRRKPQPDSFTINPARFPSNFYDDRRFSSILMDRSPLMHTRYSSSSILGDSIDFKLGSWPRVLKTENNQCSFDGQVTEGGISRYNTEKLILLLQSSNKSESGGCQLQSCEGQVGQALTLSSSSSGEDLATATFQGVSDSGCALSLLSSNSWTSRGPPPSYDHMPTRGPSMDHLMAVQHNFGLVSPDKLLTICSQSSSNGSGFPVTMNKEVLGGIENYDGHLYGWLQGSNIRGASQAANSQDIERTIDLMHRSSQTQTDDSHSQAAGMESRQFTDSQLLRSFGSSVYDTPQIL